MPKNLTVEESVKEAAESLTEETKVETTEPEVKEPEESKDDSSSEDEQETLEALTFFRALKDPSKSKLIIENLAVQAGLLKPGQQVTKTQEAEIKRDFKAIAKKHLGEDFSFLSEKLGAIIEEVLAEKDNEYSQKLMEIERRNAERQFTADYNQFLDENKVTDEEAGIMMKLADEITPAPNTSIKTYLRRLLNLARGEKALETKSKVAEQRKANNQARNAENKGVEGSQYKTEKFPKVISPRDAVMAALQGVKFEE